MHSPNRETWVAVVCVALYVYRPLLYFCHSLFVSILQQPQTHSVMLDSTSFSILLPDVTAGHLVVIPIAAIGVVFYHLFKSRKSEQVA